MDPCRCWQESKDVVIFDLNGSMQMLAEKQGCCDLRFKWIHADVGRKSKDIVIFNLNESMQMLAGKQGCCDLRSKWIHADACRKARIMWSLIKIDPCRCWQKKQGYCHLQLNGFMQMVAGKQRCCHLQFKCIHADAGRKTRMLWFSI